MTPPNSLTAAPPTTTETRTEWGVLLEYRKPPGRPRPEPRITFESEQDARARVAYFAGPNARRNGTSVHRATLLRREVTVVVEASAWTEPAE